MYFPHKVLKNFAVILGLQIMASFSPASAADLIFCVNKSTRVVTYPLSGKCASTAFALPVSQNSDSNKSDSNSKVNLPKSHTTTAAIVPKSGILKLFVPNVLGLDQARAQLTLTKSGLKVAVKALRKGPNVKVLQVVPKVGSQVTGGSVVTIVVG